LKRLTIYRIEGNNGLHGSSLEC